MTTIRLTGDLGPVEALDLRERLERETARPRPHVTVDLATVNTMHPAVVAAIVRAAQRAHLASGELRLIEPTAPPASRTIDLVSLDHLLR